MTDTTHATDSTADDFFMSLNGFDELAIAKEFKTSIGDLRQGDEPLSFLRALAFVHRRREGDKDSAAYTAVMTLTIAEVVKYFTNRDTEEDDLADDGRGARQAAADLKAAACLGWGLAPSEWDGLTLLEREAFTARAEKMGR